MFAAGMMYLGRAGPWKRMELTSPLVFLVDAEEEGGGAVPGAVNILGRIGPSKMSTHSLTFSPLDGLRVEGALIRAGEGGDWGMAVEEVRGIT